MTARLRTTTPPESAANCTSADEGKELSYRSSMEDGRLQELEGLRAQLDMLRSLVDGVPAMLAYCDASRRCRFVNRAYQTWFGGEPEAAVGKELPESLGRSTARRTSRARSAG